ncbi:PREDICTED: uncharacterized protein LOC101301843 [Fragaria vesca subsp. vesca]
MGNGVNTKVKDGAEDKPNGGGHAFSSASLDFEINKRRRQIVYREIFQNNQDLQIRSKSLEEAKKKILSYTPGAWIESVGAMKLMDYDVPKTTCLLLVGPTGSGKSSLVNKISKVFDRFASQRAQVSYNSSVSNGTLFLQEYMIPRGSTSFCLYDTRSLSDDPPENIRTLEDWMRRGVCHGKLVYRSGFLNSLQTIKKFRALEYGHVSSEIRKVNFVIFVVDAVSVLKSIESNEDAVTRYSKMIATAFNSQHLAFKDDKPLVVVTQGDLLSQVQRSRVRVHLGELLGIPPVTQIFDIPESNDPVTDLTIVDMLCYALEHADKNFPHKRKVQAASVLLCMLLSVAVLGLLIQDGR